MPELEPMNETKSTDKQKENKHFDTSLSALTSLSIPSGKMEYADSNNNFFLLATENFLGTLLGVKELCIAATTTNLTATYVNGTAGVGATLTNNGTLAPLVIDGVTIALGQKVLIAGQTTASQNGVYTLTTVGTASVAWVLTRATDYNTPAQILVGDLMCVQLGTTYGSTFFTQTATVTAIGTSAITFSPASIQLVSSVSGTSNQITVTTLNGAATVGLAPNAVLPGTGAVTLPGGTQAQRPSSPSAGMFRFNNGS